MSDLTQIQLRGLTQYDPLTGEFIWLNRPLSWFRSVGSWKRFNNRYAGKIAGGTDWSGYRNCRLDGKPYAVHRLAFLFMAGFLPTEEVDHINGIRNDNRWSNLRCVSSVENSKNRRLNKNSTTGVCGVYWRERHQKYQASIGISVAGKRKSTHLGYFNSLEEAALARKLAEEQHGYHTNHGNIPCQK